MNFLKGKIMEAKKCCLLIAMVTVSMCFLYRTGDAESSEGKQDDIVKVLTDSARDNDPLGALLKAKTIKCFLGKGCTADWNAGDPNLTIGRWREKREDCIMIFDSIDLKKGTARFIGGSGSVDVKVIATPTGVTFVEESDSGNLMITTVFASYKKGTRDHIFVHSRHMIFFGEPLSSQFHGVCSTYE